MATAAMTPPQGIMALPENDEAAAPAEALGMDETYDAVRTGLTQARPDAAADMDEVMAQIIPQLSVLSQEELEALIQTVRFLSDNPEEYKASIAELVSEDVLDQGDFPEDHDPEFLAALLTILMEAKRSRQMGAESAQMPMPPEMAMAPQGFARGGIAEAAHLVASQGRYGDTMLAHITPQEAEMLRRQGGSGTINPATGLPEYFKKFFKAVTKPFVSAAKAVGNAVKSTVKAVVNVTKKVLASPIGRVIATVGLTMIGVPPPLASMLVTKASGGSWKDSIIAGATSYLGGPTSPLAPYTSAASTALGVTSAAGQAAVSQGLTGTGIGLLTGQKFSDAVKTGITSATMAAAITGGQQLKDSYFPSAAAAADSAYTPNNAAAGEMGPPTADQFAAQPAPNFGAQASMPAMPMSPMGPPTADQFAAQPAPSFGTPVSGAATTAPTPSPAPAPYSVPSMGESATNMGQGIMQMLPGTEGSFSEGLKQFGQGAGDMFAPSGPTSAEAQQSAQRILASDTSGKMTYADALKQATAEGPGIIRSYGPGIAAGIGAMGAMGGFTPGEAPESELRKTLSGTPGQDLITADPSKYLVQGLPGVKYDERGNIVGSTPIDYNISAPMGGGAPMSSIQYQTPGIGQLASQYTPPTGSTGGASGPVAQPYNNPYMYSNLMPQQRASGGEMRPQGIASLAAGGYPRRTGQISGPGTETSDDIPAMLSDGEFVMTAKAVRGAGKGSRRAGAKSMYALMHQLEKNASRG